MAAAFSPLDSSRSAVILPILRVGFMALMAYCGMIDTALKRTSSIAAESMTGSGAPSRTTSPAMNRIRLSKWVRLFPSVDLPQPDSPARPMISPSTMPNVTPSRALTSPARVR